MEVVFRLAIFQRRTYKVSFSAACVCFSTIEELVHGLGECFVMERVLLAPSSSCWWWCGGNFGIYHVFTEPAVGHNFIKRCRCKCPMRRGTVGGSTEANIRHKISMLVLIAERCFPGAFRVRFPSFHAGWKTVGQAFDNHTTSNATHLEPPPQVGAASTIAGSSGMEGAR